jgi:inner membrane protein
MLKRTHLVIGLMVGLYFLPFIEEKILFLPFVIIGSVFPDIDAIFSLFSKSKGGFLRSLFSHRGFIHSLTAVFVLCILISFVYPPAAFPFFLGYGFHLLADSFTLQGIAPFWPLKTISNGRVKTGGKIEQILYFIFVGLTVIALIFAAFKIFA